MKQELSLNGIWQVAGYGPAGETLRLDAAVPGMIHLDLEREGIIPPMFWRDNAEQCQWVENWSWEYSRSFDVPEDADLRFARLEFGGLDTYADITLNGEPLASTNNAQVEHVFDVSARVHPGKNDIRILFTPYQQHIQGKRMDYVAAFNRSDRVHVRRMQCTFYWDWVGRFITFGPWRPVTLKFYDESRILSSFVWTHDLAKTSASLQIQLETEIRQDLVGEFTASGSNIPPETARFGNMDNDQVAYAPRPTYVPHAKIELLDPDGRRVWFRSFHIFNPTIYLQADIADPKLWWPVGYGDQPLYTCHVTLCSPDGRLLDERTHRFGIRTTRVEQLLDQPGSPEEAETNRLRERWPEPRSEETPGQGFTLLVNGERVFCKGGNWVPADPFPCRITPEKYDRLVRLAAEGNLNLLRVWGGGIYEDEAFLEACDRRGVMISYDFQLACARFPEDDDEFVDNFRDELPKAVRRLRNHAAIVWYCGDNENACHFDWDDPGAPGIRLLREVYYPVLQQLDPSRPFFPTSPYGGHNNSNSATVGDCHFGFYYDEGHPHYALRDIPRFASECAAQGSALFSTIREFMTDEDIADPEFKMFDYHVKDNPHKPEGDPTLYVKSRIVSERLFGAPKDPEDKILKDAYMYYVWADETIQAFRRRKWYASGVQFWMYNDCWPTVGLALVDYFLVPKAGWYGARRAAAPMIASITEKDGAYQVWLCNDSRRDFRGELHVYIQEHAGGRLEIARIPFVSSANQNLIAAVYTPAQLPRELDGGCQLVAEISGPEFGFHRAQYTPLFPKELVFPKAELQVSFDEERSELTVSSEQYVRAVSIDIRGFCSDNFFDLFPGESRTVHIEPYEGHGLREAQVYWFNR